MTRSALSTASLAVACLLGGGQLAHGQYPYGSNPYNRPAVSPYLNLLRGGASPAFNYTTLVRPELDFRSSLGNLQNQTLLNQQAITGLAQGGPAGPLVTGAQAGFQTHLQYFQTMTGGAAGLGFGLGAGGGQLAGGGRGVPGATPTSAGLTTGIPGSRGSGFGRGGSR
jgi:hypothetical protein